MGLKLFKFLPLDSGALKNVILFIAFFSNFNAGAQNPKPLKDKLEIIHFLKSQTAAREFKEIQVDLTADGLEELLMGTDCIVGQPCLYHIFKKNPAEKYVFSGSLMLFNLQFEVLAHKTHNFSDIFQTSVDEKNRYKLIRFEYDGKDYKPAASILGNSKISEILRPTIE